MRFKSNFLWGWMVFSLALCLLVTVDKSLRIYRLSQVLASGKLRDEYVSLAVSFAATFVIFVVFLTLALRERKALR